MINIWKFGVSDHEQFEKLVQPHIKRLYTLAYRFTGQRDDAEDLVQDVLLKIYPRLEEIQSIERLGPWLARVLYRQFVDKWRSKDRSIVQLVADEAELESVDDEVQGPAGKLDLTILQNKLQYSLNQLNEEQRHLVIMHDVEGYTLQEIHNLHDISIGTLKSRLNRARTRLRELLKNMEPFESAKRVNSNRTK